MSCEIKTNCVKVTGTDQTRKKELRNINNHKVLKRAELFNNTEGIKQEKRRTHTEAIGQKSAPEAVISRLGTLLERESENEQLQYHQANSTIKNCKKNLEHYYKIIQYTDYIPPQ